MTEKLPTLCEELLEAITDLRRTLSPVAMSAGVEYMEDCASRRDCFMSHRCEARLRTLRQAEPPAAADPAPFFPPSTAAVH